MESTEQYCVCEPIQFYLRTHVIVLEFAHDLNVVLVALHGMFYCFFSFFVIPARNFIIAIFSMVFNLILESLSGQCKNVVMWYFIKCNQST